MGRYIAFAAITTAGLAALSLEAPAEAQTAPAAYNSCSYSANGANAQTYPHSCAATSVSGTPVGNWGQISGASAAIVNGRVDESVTNVGGPPPTANYTGWADNGWTNTASATSNSLSYAYANANLSTGSVHAYATNPDANWGQSFATSQISDIVTFNNSSGGALTLSIGYTFDGVFSGVVANQGGAYASIYMALTTPDYTLKFAGSGNNLVGGTNGYASGAQALIDAGGGTYGAAGTVGLSTFMNAADYSFTGDYDAATGFTSGAFSTDIIIPVGVSQLGFSLFLDLGCRQRQITCDFGNSGLFRFAALPDGLSFTSASGTLFSAFATPPGDPNAVPEPATWAMLIFGFALIGGVVRRKKSRGAHVAA